MDDRYQFQPWHIKAYRWLRYVPYYYFAGLLLVGWWYLFGPPLEPVKKRDTYLPGDPPPDNYLDSPTRWEHAKLSFVCYHRAMTMQAMKHYWTVQEVLERIKKK